MRQRAFSSGFVYLGINEHVFCPLRRAGNTFFHIVQSRRELLKKKLRINQCVNWGYLDRDRWGQHIKQVTMAAKLIC